MVIPFLEEEKKYEFFIEWLYWHAGSDVGGDDGADIIEDHFSIYLAWFWGDMNLAGHFYTTLFFYYMIHSAESDTFFFILYFNSRYDLLQRFG